MDNPNPIRYSDLVTPDESIKQLIRQLDELIGKYEEAKAKIQAPAQEAARSLQVLSGATEQQRRQIASVASESEKLAEAYKSCNDAEREAYRKKQEVVRATKEQQRIDKLVVELNNSKEGSYNRLSAQYRLNKIRLNEMSLAEREATEGGRKLEAETKAIYEEMSRLQKATGKYTLEVGHYENALKALPGPLSQVVSGFGKMRSSIVGIAQSDLPLGAKALQGFTTVLSGTVGILMLFVRQLTGSAKTMREFEQANADLSTILGTSREGMKALTDSALSLGRATEYSARQVTQLQTELAKLGFGQGSIIAMQKSVLQFATAVGADLPAAAAVAGSALRAFNLTSRDTEDVLATLAVSTNRSALSFSRIEQSIGTVFPVANAFGFTIKDTTALLGALANAGFDASSAATATRNIILNLADSNGKLAKAIGGPVKSFDQLMDALVKLRKAGTDLNDALEMTDKRSVAAFSAFLSGAESAKELRASLEDVSGELERIQNERLDTVEGSTKLLKSAWEGLTLAFQESNGAIKDTIDWLTRLVGAMQAVLFPNQTAIQAGADNFQKILRDTYAKSGADAANAVMDSLLETYEKRAKDARFAAQDDGLLNKWLGIGSAQKNAKAAENSLSGLRQAVQVVRSQMDNDAAEAAQKAALEAEKAEGTKKAADKAALDAAKKAATEAARRRVAERRAVVEAIDLEIAVTEAGTARMLELRQDRVEAQRQLELEQNRQKTVNERQDEAAINAKYDKARLDAEKRFNDEVSKLTVQRLQAEQQAVQLEIAITEDGTDRMLELRIENIRKQREIELEQNRQKAEAVRQDEAAIKAKYDALVLREEASFANRLAQRELKAAQDLAEAEFEQLDRNERQKTLFRLEQEKARLEAILEMDKTAAERMTATEVKAIKETIKAIDKEAKKTPYKNLYELLGINLDSDQQGALNTAIDAVKDSVASLVDSWNAAADAALNAANAQVEAAQKALDAQIEARNAGYASEVETAQKELALAKAKQEEAAQEKEKAAKAQLAVDSITQASSLVTASANLWSSLSGIKVIGPALAIAAIATMWGSFAAAKVKAVQATRQETYGEGTVELLRGGSHASGNDIDLGTKPDGTRRRAEGGEYLAVINRRSSRRYGKVIPEVVNALNDGSFAHKFVRTTLLVAAASAGGRTEAGYGGTVLAGTGEPFAERMMKAGEAMAAKVYVTPGAHEGTDVSALERDVAAIRKQGDRITYVDGSGRTVEIYRNLVRKIKS